MRKFTDIRECYSLDFLDLCLNASLRQSVEKCGLTENEPDVSKPQLGGLVHFTAHRDHSLSGWMWGSGPNSIFQSSQILKVNSLAKVVVVVGGFNLCYLG